MKATVMQRLGQRMNIKKGLIVIFLAALWVASPWLTDGQAIAKTNSKTKKSLSRQLYNVSGFNKERRFLSKRRIKSSVWTRPKILQSLGMSVEQVKLINKIYKGTFNANSFYKKKLNKIVSNYHGAHLNRSIRFFRSSVGRKVVALNVKSLKASQSTYHRYLQQLVKEPPQRTRIALLDKLEAAMGLTDEIIELQATILQLTNPVNKEFSAPHAETFINRLRSDLREQLRSMILLEYMYNYRSLSNREMKKLIQFYESSSGQWFRKVDREGNLAGFATINRKALRHMEVTLKIMEADRLDIQATRVVFAPGLRQLFSDSRDPFDPLIKKPKPKKKKRSSRSKGKSKGKDSAKGSDEDIKRFDAELGGLPAIPLELYRRIKEINPRLYSDLEYYGSLFKNKKGLSGLKPSEVKEEIAQYKKLIEKAREETELLLQTPLQSKLSKLTFAGVIWDEKATIGLIETSDKKGHTIRVGSFVGPNFGVVQSIDEERVVVMEQLRSFDGSVVTRTDFIEFPRPEEK